MGAIAGLFDLAPSGALTANITDLTEKGQQLARWALEAWTNVTVSNLCLLTTIMRHYLR